MSNIFSKASEFIGLFFLSPVKLPYVILIFLKNSCLLTSTFSAKYNILSLMLDNLFFILLFIREYITYICFVIETKKAMDKPTKKRLTYNTAVIKALAEEFEVSEYFVRLAVRKEKHSRT